MSKKGKRFMWIWLEAKYLYDKTEWQTGRMNRLETELNVIRNDLNCQKARLEMLRDAIEVTLKEKMK